MTELDDAETRKSILGHRSVETLSGAIAGLAVPAGSRCGRRGHRFVQTAIALLGVEVIVELVLYPLGSLIDVVGSEALASEPLRVLMLAGLIWYLLACANIWRVALDSGLGLGIAISVGYLLLSIALEQRLLPNA